MMSVRGACFARNLAGRSVIISSDLTCPISATRVPVEVDIGLVDVEVARRTLELANRLLAVTTADTAIM